MNQPLVSIIVPVYRVEDYLETCIRSLLEQDYAELEIIAVNDASPDGSLQLLENMAAQDSRLKILTNSENKGVSASRNRALEVAAGDYVLFVDADDWLDRETVGRCLEALQKNEADVCLFAYTREFHKNSMPKYLFQSDQVLDEAGCRNLQRRLIGPVGPELAFPAMLDSLGTIWGKLYRRELLAGIQFVDLHIIGTAEDTLFNTRVFQQVKKAVYLNRPYYHYRKFNSGSETKQYKPDLYLQWNQLFTLLEAEARNEEARNALSNRIALSIFGLGLNERLSGHSWSRRKKQLQVIMNQPHYQEAYAQLTFRYFPVHWKIFFQSARRGYYCILLSLIEVIHRVINR